MRIMKLIIAFLFLSTVLSLYSCELTLYGNTEIGDIKYNFSSGNAHVVKLSEKGKEKEVIYIPDEIQGRFVTLIGENSPVSGYTVNFYSQNLKKIYLPWRAKSNLMNIIINEDVYVFNANNITVVPSYMLKNKRTVVSFWAYENSIFGTYLTESCISANISYFFNYEENPNEGYFFIDLIEETSKLTKPPYDPKRDGYTFGGWYKESECINKWNFETDEIIISFDEEGNRIYEEIKLYAKWIEK